MTRSTDRPSTIVWRPVLSLTYLSSAVDPLSTEDLTRLLTHARAKNERLGLTGMMLHSAGSFIQTLEAPRTTSTPCSASSTPIRATTRSSSCIATTSTSDTSPRGGWGSREISEEEAAGCPDSATTSAPA